METRPRNFAIRVDGISNSMLKNYGKIVGIMDHIDKKKNSTPCDIEYKKEELTREHYQDENIDPIADDLINIALATFCVDCRVQRTINKSHLFSRNINITIPVNNVELWENARPLLERTVSFVTYDVFRYRFIKKRKKSFTYEPKDSSFDSVALFSGGLDSFVGSQFLASKGYNPIFLSINHSRIDKILEGLHKAIPEKYQRTVIHVRKHFESSEFTQFSRSFLYLTFAVAIAKAYKNVEKIFIPENGIIAFQIGLKEGMYGTRTAHPRYIKYFTTLINNLFPSKNINTENPFIYKTKGEIVSLLKDKREFIKDTVSCAHGGWFKDSLQCGMCIPCIVRRISLVTNKIYDDRAISKNGIDAFRIDLDNLDIENNIDPENIKQGTKMFYRNGVVNILELLRLARNIRNLSENELIIKYPEMIDPKILVMYKKFGREVMETAKYFSKENSSLNKLI